eukprot:TRINITY_DN5771_c1_g1_i4.p1 TRINITY_DN5771_c1_g1~~TRINITY_DN5771_c1_g1_i4.p1  ORF type:complete len:391 (+),score=73.80 TRINITY_DN5771_c1_g1_i4:48-1220(+)
MGALPSVRQAVLGGTVLLLCAAVKASTLVRVVDAESPVPPRAERRPLATPPPPKPPPLPPPPPPAPSPPPQRLRRPLRLLPFGDSVTRGFCDERHFSYRRPLWGLLREAGLAASVEFVGHLQSRGQRSTDAAAAPVLSSTPSWRPPAQATAVGPARGGDWRDHRDSAESAAGGAGQTGRLPSGRCGGVRRHQRRLRVEDTVPCDHRQHTEAGGDASVSAGCTLTWTASLARSPSARVLLVAPAGMWQWRKRTRKPNSPRIVEWRLKRIADMLAEEAWPRQVIVVNASSPYRGVHFHPERHTFDGVHPNAAGEVLIAAAVFDALQTLLRGYPPVPAGQDDGSPSWLPRQELDPAAAERQAAAEEERLRARDGGARLSRGDWIVKRYRSVVK